MNPSAIIKFTLVSLFSTCSLLAKAQPDIEELDRLFNKAAEYSFAGKLDSALLLANQFVEDIPEDHYLALNTYILIGYCNNHAGYYDDALKALRKARDIGWNIKSGAYLNAINHLGNVHQNLGSTDSAIYYFNIILTKYPNKKNYVRMALSNVAIVYADLGQTEKALEYDLQSLQLELEMGLPQDVIASYHNIAYDYFELGDYDSATWYNHMAKSTYDTADRAAALPEFQERYLDMRSLEIEILQAKQQYEKALDLALQFGKEKDSILKQDKVALAKELEAKYQNEKKTKENQNLQSDLKQTQLITVLIVLFLLVSFGFIFLLYKQRKTLRIQKVELELTKDELAENIKLKTEFFANVSHDLRTPLTIIGGYLTRLRLSNPKNTELVNKIATQTDQVNYMISDLLDLSKQENNPLPPPKQDINIVSLLRKLVAAQDSAAEFKNVSIQLTIDEISYTILANAHEISKAINNLLSNAIKFAPPHSAISVIGNKEDDQFAISITDQGPGIPESDQQRIFDRFYQASNNTKNEGSGLGLAIVKGIVDRHDGQISVVSNENAGTTFQITFQITGVSKDDDMLDAIISEPVEIASNNTLLIVEDNLEMQSFIKESLPNNVRIEIAENGQEALIFIKKHKPDLIITDLMMPEMNGFELVDVLKKSDELRWIPIVVLSARHDEAGKLNLLNLGIDDYITKPFTPDELKARVSNLLMNEKSRREILKEEKANDHSKELSSQDFALLEKLKDAVLKNLDNREFSNQNLADLAALSERQTNRKLIAMTGLSIGKFIREIKLLHARDLLLKQEVNKVSELAYRLGFESGSYFSKLYFERFGKRPTDYLP